MKHLDLFSGIGGFALAARRVGWETVAFCEIDPYCQAVLRKHWPGVPIYDDVRDLHYTPAKHSPMRPGFLNDGHTATRCAVDILTGGFPCQDISVAGKGTGIDGKRSGLWSELARIIGEVRPRYAVLENVPNLLSGDRGRWFQRVLGDLAEIGFDAEWHCIPASAVGAPHQRDRVWIIGYANRSDEEAEPRLCKGEGPIAPRVRCDVSDTIGNRIRNESRRIDGENWPSQAIAEHDGAPESVADTNTIAWDDGAITESRQHQRHVAVRGCGSGSDLADAHGTREHEPQRDKPHQRRRTEDSGEPESLPDDGLRRSEGPRPGQRGIPWPIGWEFEPDVGRVAHGIPRRMDRLKGLGNAIVPQVAEIIFRSISDGR